MRVYGFSHLVFTSQSKQLPPNNILSSFYGHPKRYTFDNPKAKIDLERERGSTKEMVIYASINNNLPGLEIITTTLSVVRPLLTYGLLFPTPDSKCEAPGRQYHSRLPIDGIIPNYGTTLIDELPVLYAYSPALKTHNCTMGAWITVPNLDNAERFYSDVLLGTCVDSATSHACFTTPIVNKKLSKFLWILVEEINNRPTVNVFNDDIGLSSLGWISRDLDTLDFKQYGYEISPKFELDVGEKHFEGLFYYDKQTPSNEFLKHVIK